MAEFGLGQIQFPGEARDISLHGLFIETASLDEIRQGGSGLTNRLNVAGQNESSRLFGHKRRGLSRRELRLAAAI